MRNKKELDSMTPDIALKELIDGNKRFVNKQYVERDLIDEMKLTTESQYPYAIVLGCVDSRVPVELLFDQGIGDIFVTRIAGNYETDDVIAGMEYACQVVGSKIIMVLGHKSCGAVKATCDDVKLGYITDLVNRIKPAIAKSSFKGEVSSANKECVDAVAKTNVKLTIDRIKKKSEILNHLEKDNKIKIVGAFYDLETGKVSLLD